MHLVYSAAVVLTLVLITLPATAACAYLLLLTCLSGRPAGAPTASRRFCFDIIVPAHDEAAGIGRTISSLKALDWPREQYRIVVVADNCTDATAAVARDAGTTVLERRDAVLRGKGYALAHAFDWSRADGHADAVVVVDADSVVSANLLESFAARIEAGACALQAYYGVSNAADSWRTRLMAIAFSAIHKVRSRAREIMGLSCGIRGNGWCVTHALLAQIPYRFFSLTEDVEFGVELGLAGHRVGYCDESSVSGEMVSGEQASRSQRQRWERGRLGLIRGTVPALLHTAAKRRDAVCLDLALDLLVLPLSYLVVNVLAIATIAAAAPTRLGHGLLALALLDLAALGAYVARGWMLSGIGLEGAWDLARVPAFLVWKLLIVPFKPKPAGWIRTKREG